MKTARIAGLFLVLAAAAEAQTFRHVETVVRSRHASILAVADFNADGRDDILVGGRHRDEDPDALRPQDRLRDRAPVRVFFGTRSGRFRGAPGRFVRGTVRARNPVGIAADLNGDGRQDFAVFDAGVYVQDYGGYRNGLGNPPQLYLSRGSRLFRSAALANAVRRAHRQDPDLRYSGLGDLHIKSVTAGDIDNDGDMDLWVESNGGANIGSHFMINSGDGTRFDLDIERAPFELLHNRPPEFWRHYLGHLFDVDNDGDLDLALGQLRDDHFTHVNQFSIVLINDGTGHFPTRIELQHPRFYRGYTAVQGIADLDFNRDGWRDLALLHTRNDDLSTDEETGVLTFTGRYVQALVNRGDLTFSDETRTRIVQGPTRAQRFPNGEALYNAGGLVMRDLNRDGCLDLVLAATWGPIRRQSPIAYRNNGRGQFRPLPHKQFQRYPGDLNPGYGTWPADVNGDGLTDLVWLSWNLGPDQRPHNRDDFTEITTMLNTTRPRATRCGD